MTRARRRAVVIVAVALVALAMVTATLSNRDPAPLPPRAAKDRPTLLLLSSLPLLFGEGFSLQAAGSPALAALNRRYRVVPISTTDPGELAKGRLLLMAHPLAQPAEDLVALDQWVRAGGRVLLMADPMLEWPSKRPLGDPLRPPPMFMDTGLLGHWGLRLDPPEKRGPEFRRLGRLSVMTMSPGELFGGCAIGDDRLVARCLIGRGKATVVADADLLDVGELGSPGRNNLNALLRELAMLEQK